MFADDNNLFYINEYIKTLDTETLESKKKIIIIISGLSHTSCP